MDAGKGAVLSSILAALEGIERLLERQHEDNELLRKAIGKDSDSNNVDENENDKGALVRAKSPTVSLEFTESNLTGSDTGSGCTVDNIPY